ncbi:hypothetical protein AAIH49_33425, partial [Pseudomonas aeruginosa]|uniref:hypothetical protein n=1 Tax=Pseudomonas aeruginosa TaxID=287 RepID=UPI0031B68145
EAGRLRGQGVILSPVCGHLFVFHRSPADCSENGGFLNMALQAMKYRVRWSSMCKNTRLSIYGW